MDRLTNIPGKRPRSKPTNAITAPPGKPFISLTVKEIRHVLGKSLYPVCLDFSSTDFQLDSDRFALNCPDVVKELYLDNNAIKIVNSFSHFSKLMILVLDNNSITTMSLRGLTSLVHLSIRRNQLQAFQDVIEMKKLTFLDVSFNNMKILVDDLSKFKSLRVLDVSNNPLGESAIESPTSKVENLVKSLSQNLKKLEYFSMNNIYNVKQSQIVKWVLGNFKKLTYYNWVKITKKDRETRTMDNFPESKISELVNQSALEKVMATPSNVTTNQSNEKQSKKEQPRDDLDKLFDDIIVDIPKSLSNANDLGKESLTDYGYLENPATPENNEMSDQYLAPKLSPPKAFDSQAFINTLNSALDFDDFDEKEPEIVDEGISDILMKEAEEQREREEREREREEREREEREEREREEREREEREREQREREQKEREREREREQEQEKKTKVKVKEREQREREQREREQREREQKEREQREREQKEREQKEREQKEREQKEREKKEREKKEKEEKKKKEKSSSSKSHKSHKDGTQKKKLKKSKSREDSNDTISESDESVPNPIKLSRPNADLGLTKGDKHAPKPQTAIFSTGFEDHGRDWVVSSEEIELLELLGDGGLGESYIAAEIKERKAVVKTLRPQNINADFVSELIEQTKKAVQLSHSSLCPYIGLCIDRTLCIVSQFVEGIPLNRILADPKSPQTLDISKRNVIGRQILLGLSYLHDEKFTHGILKSADVLVDLNSLSVKLTSYYYPAIKYSVLKMGVVFDTEYVAPELFQTELKTSSIFTKEADVYSFGILLWELYEGGFPHFRPNAEPTKQPKKIKPDNRFEINAIGNDFHSFTDRLPFLPSHFRRTPSGFISLIQSATSFSPKERPTLNEFLLSFDTNSNETTMASGTGLTPDQLVKFKKISVIKSKLVELLESPSPECAIKAINGTLELVKQPTTLKYLISENFFASVFKSPEIRNERVQEHVVGLFIVLADDDEFCSHFVKQWDGYSFLAKFIRSSNPILIMKTFTLVRKLVFNPAFVTLSFMQSGFINVLVDMLNDTETSFPTLVSTLSTCCRISRVSEPRKLLYSLFNPSALTRFLQSNTPALRCKATILLGCYLIDDHEENKILVKILRGLLVVKNEKLKNNAIKALSLCAGSPGFLKWIDVRSYLALTAELFTTTTEERILEYIAIALRSLCVDEACCDFCLSAGVLAKCNNILNAQTGPISPMIIANIDLLAQLFTCATCRDGLHEVGGVGPLLAILARCGYSKNATNSALNACAVLAQDESWVEYFVTGKSVPIFMMQLLVAAHRMDRTKLEVCCRIMRLLAQGSPKAALPITLERGLEVINFVLLGEIQNLQGGFKPLVEDICNLTLILLQHDDCRAEVPMESVEVLFKVLCTPAITLELSNMICQFISDFSTEAEVLELLLFSNCAGELVRCLSSNMEVHQRLALGCIYKLYKLNNKEINTALTNANLQNALDILSKKAGGSVREAASRLKNLF